MYLAVGDVVRDRRDMALGIVARVYDVDRRVVLAVPGSVPRAVFAEDLDVVSRYTPPMTTRLRLMGAYFFLLALVASYVAAHSVHSLGGNSLLMVLAALGAYEPFGIGFRWYQRLTGPRRFRV
ncbi:hypothetical protein ACJ6WF_21050 [Streptomyces sp. MMS24-I2-30]|uniref:hypothetical protein n=1 Tax=Streptomyces sp. MMS24-I2-30 TaxID=3351564 RepID=UPI003896E73D